MLNNKKGVTLIELIVVIAIMSVVISAVYFTLQAGNNIYSDADARDNTESSMNLIVNDISNQVKSARSYIPTAYINNDPRYNTDLLHNENKILYVENNYNERYVYVLRGTELHKLCFNQTKYMQKYKPVIDSKDNGDGTYSYSYEKELIPEINSDASYGAYVQPMINSDSYIEGKSDDIDDVNITNGLNDRLSDYVIKGRIYEQAGEECYILAQRNGTEEYYKIKLIEEPNLDFTSITSDKLIADYVTSIEIDADNTTYYSEDGEEVQPTPTPTDSNRENFKFGNSVTIKITTGNKDKSKQVTTRVFLSNNRGDK